LRRPLELAQYVSIKYTERLAEAGVEPSVGSVGDSYDNALAETINGLYKAEVIHQRGPWRSFEAVEFATLEWVNWFNYRRLLEPIGNIPPAEAEQRYYAMLEQLAMAASLKRNGLRQTRGGSNLEHRYTRGAHLADKFNDFLKFAAHSRYGGCLTASDARCAFEAKIRKADRCYQLRDRRGGLCKDHFLIKKRPSDVG